jgi:hypothetical protein
MTKRNFIIIAAFAFVLGLGSATASAQGQILRAEIPFEFTVGKTTLPAGEYIVKLPETGGARVVSFKKADGEDFGMAMTNEVDSKDTGIANGLVFVKSGDKYILHQVHTTGREIGQEVVKTRRLAGAELARKTVALKPAKS